MGKRGNPKKQNHYMLQVVVGVDLGQKFENLCLCAYNVTSMIKKFPFYILMVSVVAFFTACSSAVSEKKRDRCEGLNEDQCLASAECRGVYGPSKCYDNGMCTEDLAFKGCKQMSVEVLEKGRVDRQLCEDTGGLWDVNFYTKPGTCQCKNRMMIKDKGCAVLKKSVAPEFLQ